MNNVELIIRQAKRGGKQDLNLSDKNLETVSTEVYNISSLLTLNLSNNKITEIDKQIENLKNLKELDLSNNEILTLPIELVQHPTLLVLKLNNNPIASFLTDITSTNWKTQLKNYLLNKIKNGSNKNAGENKSNQLSWLEDVPKVQYNDVRNINMNSTMMSMFSSRETARMNMNINSISLDKNEIDQKIAELENQLRKEILTNKRYQKEIERLTLQISSGGSSGGMNSSNNSDFILKSKMFIKQNNRC